MSETVIKPPSSDAEMTRTTRPYQDDIHPYRAFSKAAVISLVLCLLAPMAWLTATLLALPAVGCLTALFALQRIRKYPDELMGKTVAQTSLAGCFFLLIGLSAMHAYVYATEVPDGYERVSFVSLKSPPSLPDFPPEEALALDGKNVFLTGYIHPSVAGAGAIKKFVLVPDLGTCCFGGQPPLTHMIEVTVVGKTPVEYSMRRRKLVGQLHIDRRLKPVSGLNGVYYQMDAEYVK